MPPYIAEGRSRRVRVPRTERLHQEDMAGSRWSGTIFVIPPVSKTFRRGAWLATAAPEARAPAWLAERVNRERSRLFREGLEQLPHR
jgi:hypothetical protein